MDVSIQYLSFFVIQTDGQSKSFKHYQTLDQDSYEDSEIKSFLDGELARICKRRADRNPQTEQAPTKVGRFIVEPGYELAGNPNYALFHRIRYAEDAQQFLYAGEELVREYMDTSAVRGGALIVARAKLNKWFDDPLLFVMKCDFEPKIARISDERSLVQHVEMAISAKNMKSILYPHMPEEGVLEEWELKLHQASHARYFEDFLRFVSYEPAIPQLISSQVLNIVQEYMEEKWEAAPPELQAEGRQREEQELELWAASDKRELQQLWSHEQVAAASARIIEHQPEVELKFKVGGGIQVRALLADYGDTIHVAQLNGRYVVLIEGSALQFEKGFSPIELLHPEPFEQVAEKLLTKEWSTDDGWDTGNIGETDGNSDSGDDTPW